MSNSTCQKITVAMDSVCSKCHVKPAQKSPTGNSYTDLDSGQPLCQACWFAMILAELHAIQSELTFYQAFCKPENPDKLQAMLAEADAMKRATKMARRAASKAKSRA